MRERLLPLVEPAMVLLASFVIVLFILEICRSVSDWRERKHLKAIERDAAKHAYGPWRWSQDGYVRVCKLCREYQYGGDDYDGGPRP